MIPNQELAETNMKKYMKKMIELDRKFNEKEIIKEYWVERNYSKAWGMTWLII